MFDIQENLKKLPDKPGVYLHKDNLGHVIYVGKAVSLKNRVRQYFQSQTNMAPKVRAMVSHIEEFEYITTDSEMEAFILENNLIKKYQPQYNILLRDDKTYPYIKVTLGEDYPRVVKTRRVLDDGGRYFGPYSDVGAVNEIIDLLNNVYELKRCSAKSFPQGFRPCLNYHIEQCRGVCAGGISRDEYRKVIDEVCAFLKGNNRDLLASLEKKMNEASEALNFERAAEFRDRIAAVKTISEKQKVVLGAANDMDLILTAKSVTGYHIILFFVRNGKLSGRESFPLGDAEDIIEAADFSEPSDRVNRAALTSYFIRQYYNSDMLIPKEIAVEYLPDDAPLLEEWMATLRHSKVKIYEPQRGDKHGLMEMARRDVIEMMKVLDDRANAKREREDAVSAELNRVFGHSWQTRRPAGQPNDPAACTWRIESYDISNTMGVDSVGGMVVFENGRPQRKSYRKFKIKTVDGPDDYMSMQEVIYRRFSRALKGDPGFSTYPDIIFVDGGLGHVNAVEEVLSAMKITRVIVAGMVKDDRHRTRGLIVDHEELDLRQRPVLFRYVTTIQDEVHRFAIGYHDSIRNKNMQRSVLDDAPGIGPKRKLELLNHFGSIENLRRAAPEEIADLQTMTKNAAEVLYNYLKEH